MQEMAKKPPKCPNCNEELTYIAEILEQKYDFNSEDGNYKHVDDWLAGSLKVLCPFCDARLDEHETLGFAEGACNYPHGRI